MEIANIDIRDAFFDEIYNIGANEDVIFITADADAFGLRRFKKDFPEQFINIGVAEQNMIAVAAGLALSGKRVFIYAIIPFITMRCYEHIKVNICSMHLPVTIIGAGAGLSFGFDGPTHHAVHDIAVMRILPEISIYNPSDSLMAKKCADIAYKTNTPVYIRLDKGTIKQIYNDNEEFSDGLSLLNHGKDVCIVSTGIMVHNALKAAERLLKDNIDAGVIDIYRLKPISGKMLIDILSAYKYVFTLEENSIVGGLGTIISEIVADNKLSVYLKRIAIKDEQSFRYGERDWLHEYYGLDATAVANTILESLKNVKSNS